MTSPAALLAVASTVAVLAAAAAAWAVVCRYRDRQASSGQVWWAVGSATVGWAGVVGYALSGRWWWWAGVAGWLLLSQLALYRLGLRRPAAGADACRLVPRQAAAGRPGRH